MIDDDAWLRAVRMVRGTRRNGLEPKVDDRFVWNPRRGWRRIDRAMSSNPQLQVLGDWTRPNPSPAMMPNYSAPDAVTRALKRFHGKSTGEIVSEYAVEDGDSDQIELAYLGHVPAVAWLSKKTGSAPKQIDVKGELVRFNGFRTLFRGQSRPILALHTPTNEAVVVQGTVDSLMDRCDDGVLGLAPVVEYIVEFEDGSSKGDYHYVHEFKKDAEPVLRWSDKVGGLVYDRDRTLVADRLKNKGYKTAVYEVTDWFKEKGERDRH